MHQIVLLLIIFDSPGCPFHILPMTSSSFFCEAKWRQKANYSVKVKCIYGLILHIHVNILVRGSFEFVSVSHVDVLAPG